MTPEEQQALLDAADQQSASLSTLQDRAGSKIQKILASALSSTLPGVLQAYRRYTSALRPTEQPIPDTDPIYTPTGAGAQAEARRRALRAEIDRFSRQVDTAAIQDVAESVLTQAAELGDQAAVRFGAMQDLPIAPAGRPPQDIRTLASSITGKISAEADGFRSIMSQIISDSAVQGFPGKRVERVVIEAFQGDQLPDGTIKSRGMVQRAMFNIETEVSIVSLEQQMETIRKAGHRYVRWVTAQDEKVCGFCASRHGKVYLSDQIRIPAHSRCRCMAVPVKPEDIGPDAQDAVFWKEEQDATIAAYAKAHNLTPEEAARKLQEYGRKPTQFEKYAQPVDPKPVQAVWEPGQQQRSSPAITNQSSANPPLRDRGSIPELPPPLIGQNVFMGRAVSLVQGDIDATLDVLALLPGEAGRNAARMRRFIADANIRMGITREFGANPEEWFLEIKDTIKSPQWKAAIRDAKAAGTIARETNDIRMLAVANPTWEGHSATEFAWISLRAPSHSGSMTEFAASLRAAEIGQSLKMAAEGAPVHMLGFDSLHTSSRWASVMTHEVGHQIHRAAGWLDRDGFPVNAFSRVGSKVVSRYAATNAQEDFAESFAAYIFNPSALREYDQETYDWVDSIVRKVTK